MYYTKYFYPHNDAFLRSKHVALQTLTYLLTCVDCYYVIITWKHSRMIKLKRYYLSWDIIILSQWFHTSFGGLA